MSQAILSIESDTPANPRTTAHLLPCRVHYDGPVEPAQSYWSPTGKDGTYTHGENPLSPRFRGSSLDSVVR